MLILPLHHPLTRRNFPWLTAVLVVINVLVFFGPQARDDERRVAAEQYAQNSGLVKLESDAYARYQQRVDKDPATQAEEADLPEPMRAWARQAAMRSDRRFWEGLEQGQWFASPEDWQRWQSLDAHREALLADVVTEHYALPSSDAQPGQYLSSMFLHGSMEHLLGNMLFLIALGPLVEAPLGALCFVLL